MVRKGGHLSAAHKAKISASLKARAAARRRQSPGQTKNRLLHRETLSENSHHSRDSHIHRAVADALRMKHNRQRAAFGATLNSSQKKKLRKAGSKRVSFTEGKRRR